MTSETDRQADRQTGPKGSPWVWWSQDTLGEFTHAPVHSKAIQSHAVRCTHRKSYHWAKNCNLLTFCRCIYLHVSLCPELLYLYAFWVCGGNGIKYLARGKQRLSTCTGRLSEIMLPRERSPGNSPAALDGPCQSTLVDTRTQTHYMWETCHGKIWEVWIVIHMHIVQIHACMHACRKTGYCTSMCSDGVTWWRWRRRDWTHWCINDDGDG